MMNDPYAVLGLPQTASSSQVKAAYRKLAKKYHPDLNPGNRFATSKFVEAHQAYERITNGSAAVPADPQSIWRTWATFGSVFPRLQAQRRRSPGVAKDVNTSVTVSLGEAYFGSRKEIRYLRVEFCESCDTTGFNPKSKPMKCFLCSGTGRFGSGLCWICGGDGQEKAKCEACWGAGWVRREAEAELDIPAKMPRMFQMIVKGAGNRLSRNAPAGNLCLHLTYPENDPDSAISATPNGSLLWEIRVPWYLSLLGQNHVVYPFGMGIPLTVVLRADAENGHVYEIKNAGMRRGRPFLVKVFYVLPTNMTAEDIRILTGVLSKYASAKTNAGTHEDHEGRRGCLHLQDEKSSELPSGLPEDSP